uniref:ULP_PROTEASE domain-containing protein n=1 Tax=Trichuris muris TaxID=70415 RepID=A0A5S6Q7G9_TRIMR
MRFLFNCGGDSSDAQMYSCVKWVKQCTILRSSGDPANPSLGSHPMSWRSFVNQRKRRFRRKRTEQNKVRIAFSFKKGPPSSETGCYSRPVTAANGVINSPDSAKERTGRVELGFRCMKSCGKNHNGRRRVIAAMKTVIKCLHRREPVGSVDRQTTAGEMRISEPITARTVNRSVRCRQRLWTCQRAFRCFLKEKEDGALRRGIFKVSAASGNARPPVRSPRECHFIVLNQKQRRVVMRTWSCCQKGENLLITKSTNAKIRGKDLLTLRHHNWLNDEVLNNYMDLIVNRSLAHPELPRVFAFSTFFYVTYLAHSYAGVRWFTESCNLFEHDLIIVPIYKSSHWALVVVDFRGKTVKYYDSLRHDGTVALKTVRAYLSTESKVKRKTNMEFRHWTFGIDEACPIQMNNDDCGVFVLAIAELLSRDKVLSFHQKHIRQFRERIAFEIIQGTLFLKDNRTRKPQTLGGAA